MCSLHRYLQFKKKEHKDQDRGSQEEGSVQCGKEITVFKRRAEGRQTYLGVLLSDSL